MSPIVAPRHEPRLRGGSAGARRPPGPSVRQVLAGPVTMKSLYMTRRRFSILPSSTYFSEAGAWASVTSACRARQDQRWPVPARSSSRVPGRLPVGTGTSRSQVLRARRRRQDGVLGVARSGRAVPPCGWPGLRDESAWRVVGYLESPRLRPGGVAFGGSGAVSRTGQLDCLRDSMNETGGWRLPGAPLSGGLARAACRRPGQLGQTRPDWSSRAPRRSSSRRAARANSLTSA